MFLISDKAFEAPIARAQEVAEEGWRRLVFDNLGVGNLPPEVAKLIHDHVVDALAERYCEDIGRCAARMGPSS